MVGGNNIVVIIVSDDILLILIDSISFVIDVGVIGDYNFYINEGYISWGEGYFVCYLVFGIVVFIMCEYFVGIN